MKTIKRYDVRGMMEWHPVFKVGRTRLRVSFTGGHLCGGGCTPASFETSDPVLQKVVEGSEAFRSGRITVGMVMETGVQGREQVCVYDNVEDIIDFLQDKKDVPLERMLSADSVFSEARRLGVVLKKKTADGHEV